MSRLFSQGKGARKLAPDANTFKDLASEEPNLGSNKWLQSALEAMFRVVLRLRSLA